MDETPLAITELKIPQAPSCISNPEEEGHIARLLVKFAGSLLGELDRVKPSE
jgi:hypothetical protein